MIADYNGIQTRIAHGHDTLTGINFSKKEKIIINIKKALIKNHASNFCACSLEAGTDIFGLKFFAKNGSVIPNVIPYKTFFDINEENVHSLKEKHNITENQIVIGNISRFEPKKNQDFIIDVFGKIHEKSNKYILVLGGVDGGQEQFIKDKVNSLGLSDYVRFIGPRNDVKDWLHIINIYLFPSLFEGLGIVCLENQASNLFTIASTNVPSITDLGIGLIKYLPLDSKEEWISEIQNYAKQTVALDIIEAQMVEKNYSSTEALEKVYK